MIVAYKNSNISENSTIFKILTHLFLNETLNLLSKCIIFHTKAGLDLDQEVSSSTQSMVLNFYQCHSIYCERGNILMLYTKIIKT